MSDLEVMTDQTVYQVLQVSQPALVAAIADLLKAGQTPAQIERWAVGKWGRNQTTRNIRHVAEHLARSK